jgi:hypothetical protein
MCTAVRLEVDAIRSAREPVEITERMGILNYKPSYK